MCSETISCGVPVKMWISYFTGTFITISPCAKLKRVTRAVSSQRPRPPSVQKKGIGQ